MRGLEEAWEGRRDLDHQLEDLRETIARLEGMVMEQGQELRALRRQRNDE